MDVGEVLLYAGLAAGTGAILLYAFGLARHEQRFRRVADRLLLVTAASVAGALATLISYFLRGDLSYYYVWNYTKVDYEAPYRLAGVWGGQAGTLLLWATVALAALVMELRIQGALKRARSLEENDTRFFDAMKLFAVGAAISLLYMVVDLGLFSLTADYCFLANAGTGDFVYAPGCNSAFTPLVVRPQGNGLNPLLMSPFMVIHPPVEFTSYGLIILAGAAGAAYVATGSRIWNETCLLWTRLSWLFLTTGVALGALWAYYVLSFGGYWAWDPVETGNLLPWIALTLLQHALPQERKKKGYEHFAPFAAITAFAATILATFITRSNLWAASAHAFLPGGSNDPDPLVRLMSVMAVSESVAYLSRLLIVIVLGTGILFLFRYVRHREGGGERRPLVAVTYIGLYAALIIIALVDVRTLAQQGAAAVHLVGAGNTLFGWALLFLVLIGVPLVALIWSMPEGEEKAYKSPLELVNIDTLMAAGIALFAVGFALTLLLLLLAVNFLPKEIYDTRLAYVVIPLVLVMGVTLSCRFIGASRSVAMALAALGVGAIGYLALGNWGWLALGVPVLGFGFASTLHRTMKAAEPSDGAHAGTRVAGYALVAAGVLGFVFWASPPARVGILGLSVAVPLFLVPIGLAAAASSLLLAVPVLSGRGRRAHVFGAIAAFVAFGYGASFLLGLFVMAKAVAKDTTLRPWDIRPLRSQFMKTGRYAMHVGAVLIIIGYGASTFYQETVGFNTISSWERGSTKEIGDYALTFVDSNGIDTDGDGRYEEVTAVIRVETKSGRFVEDSPMTLYWEKDQARHFSREYVTRDGVFDVYLNADPFNPPVFKTAADGWQSTSSLTAAGPRQFTEADVEAIALSVRTLPLVGCVWAGVALIDVGMIVILATFPGRAAVRPARKDASTAPAPA
ncbi:MAG: cytochrome c biogenesis protein CcsA [Euryarchaeota archaeon]|nr:cytochrome c biogenesis protein CcsA [Euryarchaeota archaeon]